MRRLDSLLCGRSLEPLWGCGYCRVLDYPTTRSRKNQHKVGCLQYDRIQYNTIRYNTIEDLDGVREKGV
jgi:hypothetical protein